MARRFIKKYTGRQHIGVLIFVVLILHTCVKLVLSGKFKLYTQSLLVTIDWYITRA
jgi:hypothetical protein